MRVRHSLALEITAAIAFKAIALLALYIAFFGPSQQVSVTADRMAETVFGAAPPAR